MNGQLCLAFRGQPETDKENWNNERKVSGVGPSASSVSTFREPLPEASDLENSTTWCTTILFELYSSGRTGGNPAAFLEHSCKFRFSCNAKYIDF